VTSKPNYAEWHEQRTGSWKGVSLEDRFWSRVHPDPNTGCWLWGGSPISGGYGVLSRTINGKSRPIRATHVSLMLHGRPVPAGMEACHTCNFPPCVNPDHLFVGTHKENMEHCAASGRFVTAPGWHGPRQRRLICLRGHRVEGDNVYFISGKYPRTGCRACRSINGLRARAKANG
jgi:hypothetical protein